MPIMVMVIDEFRYSNLICGVAQLYSRPAQT